MSGKNNLFSKVGLGADSVTFTLHQQALTLYIAIMWRGRHCFLTAIRERGLLFLEVAALVDTVDCLGDADTGQPGPRFPGMLTEKYLRHEQLEPMARNTICYVLVTPKVVALTPGSLVEISETPYEVLVVHDLDPYKNEYEILRKKEL